MGLRSAIRELFRREPKAETTRRWQGAPIDRLNRGHWSNVSAQPINSDLSQNLDSIRHRCEDEISKNSLIEGMISSYALSCVGSTGPTLKIVSEDKEYCESREQLWKWWANNAGSNQQLGIADIMWLWIRSLFGSGEFVDQFVSLPDAPGPVKMRLLPIHAHRLMTPPEFLGDHAVAMGVRRDLQNRRPVCYYISEPYLMGAFEVYTGEFLEVPFRDLLHGFLIQEEDQVRGVPWLAPCLDNIGELRDSVSTMLDSIRAAGDWGVYVQTPNPEAVGMTGLNPNQLPPDVPFQRRQERYLPPGSLAATVNPQQPPARWEEFYRSRVQEIGRAANMPLLMMLLDSSDHNFASARFDSQLFWRGIQRTQGFLARSLDRIEDLVAREAELAYATGDTEGLPPRPKGLIERRWLWPQAPEVDSSKERMADRLGLENGTLTLTELCARDNKDVSHVIAERAKENKLLLAAGLPAIPGIPDPSLGKDGGSEGDDGGDGWKAPNRIGTHLVSGNGQSNGKGKANVRR